MREVECEHYIERCYPWKTQTTLLKGKRRTCGREGTAVRPLLTTLQAPQQGLETLFFARKSLTKKLLLQERVTTQTPESTPNSRGRQQCLLYFLTLCPPSTHSPKTPGIKEKEMEKHRQKCMCNTIFP